MANKCERSFDEALLTGYLDHALPQSQAQRVRLHLEDCRPCRKFYDELGTLRQAALTTCFATPEDEVWPELPQTRASWLSRSTGWWLLVIWLAVVGGLSLWHSLQQSHDPLEIFVIFGLPCAFLLLFASVLFDRLRDLKTDRYKGIHR
jgi:predicted anti-sigma-YlaC factor YlaD